MSSVQTIYTSGKIEHLQIDSIQLSRNLLFNGFRKVIAHRNIFLNQEGSLSLSSTAHLLVLSVSFEDLDAPFLNPNAFQLL